MHHVIDEENEYGYADEQQPESDGDGEARVLGVRCPGRLSDDVHAGAVVDDRRDEQAQHDLRGTIAQEVAHEPGRVPVRRDLQRDHGQPDHERQHADQRAGDREQHLLSLVGVAAEQQRGDRRIRTDVDQREEAADGDRAGHEQHRDDPQCAAELVSTLFPRNSRHLSLLAASGTRRSPVVLLLFTLWGPRGQGVTHGRFKIMT
jgi:hypothetical protein